LVSKKEKTLTQFVGFHGWLGLSDIPSGKFLGKSLRREQAFP
jgi:hypothetical protein